MIPNHRFLYGLLVAVLTLTPLVGCSSESSEQEGTDSSLETATDEKDTLGVPVAEIDTIVSRYYAAADSLGRLFASIETEADVADAAEAIEHLHREIAEFNRLTITYGEIVVERMATRPDGGAFDRLLAERERLRAKSEVYAKIEEIEQRVTEVEEVDPESNESVEGD